MHMLMEVPLSCWRDPWLYRIFISDNIPIDLPLIVEIVDAGGLQKDRGDGDVTLEYDLHTHTQSDTETHNYTHTNVYTPRQILQHPRFSEYVTVLHNHR